MPSVRYRRALFWFRRDLRAYDNAGLYHALKSAREVYCIFVFDREILDGLPHPADRRVEFIHGSVVELKERLRALGGDLLVRYARASDDIPRFAAELGINAVFANEDYEPAAIVRDMKVAQRLAEQGIAFEAFKDQVVFAKGEVLSKSDKPYSVYTPYKNAWLHRLDPFFVKAYPIEPYRERLVCRSVDAGVPTLEEMGFAPTNLKALGIAPGMSAATATFGDFQARIAKYDEARNFPSAEGVSYLSVHLRFGTISIRELAAFAHRRRGAGAQTWLSELIWRDFYFQILHHFPRVASGPFKPEFRMLVWENNEALFAAWCEGRTGYPIVDAAMRQLNQTGYMHNRLRMIVASFLTKDLLIDWRWGEKYFADRLNDYDLAANNGGWQWAASTGCDAQPYFRIFNPVSQSERFDPKGAFIRRYVPELGDAPAALIHAPWTMSPAEQNDANVIVGKNYPAPIVDHNERRKLALALYTRATGR